MPDSTEPLTDEGLSNLRGWLDPQGPAFHLKTGISVDDALRLIARLDATALRAQRYREALVEISTWCDSPQSKVRAVVRNVEQITRAALSEGSE